MKKNKLKTSAKPIEALDEISDNSLKKTNGGASLPVPMLGLTGLGHGAPLFGMPAPKPVHHHHHHKK